MRALLAIGRRRRMLAGGRELSVTGLDELFAAAQEDATPPVWGAAVGLARDGAIVGVHDDGDEILLKVKTRQRSLPFEVYLWPDDVDWGCDCGFLGEVCVHVCAALISLRRARHEGKKLSSLPSLPTAKKTFRVKLLYSFTTDESLLSVQRLVVYPSGQTSVLKGSLKDSDLIATAADVHAEAVLALQQGHLPANMVRRLLTLLGRGAEATLDGQPVTLSAEPIRFCVRVADEADGFKAGLFRPSGIDRLFRGAALVKNMLRPTSHGKLTPEQRSLLVRGLHFEPEEVGRLVGEYIPNLRERIDVEICTERLPTSRQLMPHVVLKLTEAPTGLVVFGEIVYGDPPIARLKGGVLKPLGSAVPVRDLGAERTLARRFEARMGLMVGYEHRLTPGRAADFLHHRLPLHDGIVEGKVQADHFRIAEKPVEPIIRVDQVGDSWRLKVRFAGEDGEADALATLSAWRSGRSLVPLLDGGYAPLPTDWLAQHGPLLRELLEARNARGEVGRNATAALVELLEDTEADVPFDLRRLRSFLEGGDGLPEVELPQGFQGTLRSYQQVGYRWLRFLASMDLNGILADDMGLGKTVQALVSLAEVPGPHLVVAPTSVLKNWERESYRFCPQITVNLYHGPQRQLDQSQLTLTSYALLRIDADKLRDIKWSYVILDEAQAIKNASSKTAMVAYKMPSKHRLCLTGTPIENRLEELWSLFRFLMPGLFGSLEAFRERFSRPIENGDVSARKTLRGRVRPYVLRRLKQQVASELPKLTDIVMRCEMSDAQRRVYEAVRLTARHDVAKALGENQRGATFQILEALLRMRQACCDPTLLPGNVDDAPSCKLDRLDELLVEIVCGDHKALIFSQWTSLLDRVEPRLKQLGIEWLRLDGSTRHRQPIIDEFQSSAGPPVFLLSLKAGGFGLNLTAADYVVHLDPWWNPAIQQQATDRAHRIGQDKPVVSCRLIAAGTVEERILELQEAKRDLADAALGTEGGFVKALTGEELQSLFDASS